jgi:GT2 family glycosyltransferase
MNLPFAGQVCLVTVTYGRRWRYLRECLSSARAQGVAQAVVVDNGAEEEVAALAHAEFGGFARVCAQGKNTGSAGGYKAGIARALALGAEYVLLLDDDNRMQPDCLARLWAAYQAAACAGVPAHALAVLAYRPDRQADAAAQVPASGMDLCPEAFFGFQLGDVPFKLFRRTFLGRRWLAGRKVLDQVVVSIAPYSGLFFHRAVPEVLGLPDERFVLYADDTDFSYRLTRQGGRIVLVSDARLEDMELSWNLKSRYNNTFDALLLGEGNLRAYYSTRNRAYFERGYLTDDAQVFRAINRGIYLLALWMRALQLGRQERFRLLMRAIRDGEAGRLGVDKEYPL